MSGTVYLRGYVQRADGDSTQDGPVRFVAATEGRKGDGIDLRMDRLDLARYRANPVVLYGHAYWGAESLPIGRAENIEVEGKQLLVDVVFDSTDDFAAKVERKVRGKFLNAMSVGFSVGKIDDDGVPDSWELFENSIVPLPMDPNAVAGDERGRQLALVRALSTIDPARLDAALTALTDPRATTPPPGPAPVSPRLAAARRRLQVATHTWS